MEITRRGVIGLLAGSGAFLFGKASGIDAGISALEQIAGGEAHATPAKRAPQKEKPKQTQKKALPAQSPFSIPESPDVFITRSYHVPTRSEYWQAVKKGTLEFLQKTYGTTSFWSYMGGAKNINDVDIEKRIHNILHWLRQGAEENKETYPVDPLLIIAQIHEESRFYEFAISPVCAAGIAQFIKPSARSFGMVCAGKANAQGCKAPSYAASYENFLKMRIKRRRMKSAVLDEEDLPLAYLDIKRMNQHEQELLQKYKRFLRVNVENRDIFNKEDMAFINKFDQRFGYRHSITAMVTYMAQNLKSTRGYVSASLVGYNAGMGHVEKKKGRMPHIWSSANYAENILFTYRAIAREANG